METASEKGESMGRQMEHRNRLASLLDELAVNEGPQGTLIEGVEVSRRSQSSPRIPVVYQPNIVIVGQGQKRCYLGGEVYQYDPLNYLVVSVPLPVEGEWIASPDEPVLILAVTVDQSMLGEMILDLDEQLPPIGPISRGICTTPMNDELIVAAVRLLECLKSLRDSRILGRQMVREVVYRVLCGEQGGALRTLASRDDHFTRIARALRHIHAEYAKPLNAEDMAKRAGMSVSAFNHHFRLVAASSPLQYLKRIRLDHAKRLMAHDGYNASTAARAVGYESPSQFSREFKRLFGATPSEDAEQIRGRLVTR
jgi:AraC-like DNA-binding protein